MVPEVVKRSFECDSAGTFVHAFLMYRIGVVSEVVVAPFFFRERHSLCAPSWYRITCTSR